MNKFAISLAVLALINNASAIRMRDEDLFNDEAQLAETMSSIKAAEKLHGKTFNGVSVE